MVKVIWTKRAFSQLERAIKYIKEEQGVAYAQIVLTKTLEKTRLLEITPKIGQSEPLLKHKKSEYRYIIVWSYKIIYRLDKDKVVISKGFPYLKKSKKIERIMTEGLKVPNKRL